MKFIFLCFGIKTSLVKMLEYFLNMPVMFIHVIWVNEYIIQINYDIDIQNIREEVVYYIPSPLVQKLHLYSDIIFQLYKPAFHGSHISCNTTVRHVATIQVITNFIQLVSPQPVDQFSQTKLHWKAPNEGYPHICRIYKSDNKWLIYQAISSCKSFVC